MKKIRPTIRTTLFLIIGIMTILIVAQAVYSLYGSIVDYRNSYTLRAVATSVNGLFDAEKYLSLERASALAALSVKHVSVETIKNDMLRNRAMADKILNLAVGQEMAGRESESEFLSLSLAEKVRQSHLELQKKRQTLDAALEKKNDRMDDALAEAFFAVATTLISDIHDYIDVYSRPYLALNPDVTRQMRFSHTVWNITEYAGREYALLGRMIAENQYPSPEMQLQLAVWHGRISYAWENAHSAIANNPYLEEIRPLMDEAETRYFITFEQVRNILQRPLRPLARPAYPMSIDTWMALASQAVNAMHAMNDGVMKVNRFYVDEARADAARAIMINLTLLAAALLLSLWSWRVIISRVIMPVNSMVDALYKATQGEYVDLPANTYGHDEVGKLARVLTTFRENARQLSEERDRANAASVAKSEFLANMSHEIRTPMNVVLGLSNILARTSLTEKQKEYISTLRLSAESLLSLINDLLDFSKIETRAFKLEHIPFDLAALILEVTTLFKVKLEEKNLVLETSLGDLSGKSFVGDPTRIRQIITNLYGNAIKFTEHGKIVIAAHSVAGAPDAPNQVFITIRDTGIGIPADKVGTVFDKFTQVDATISRKYGGTGLGLAITKAFVDMMGGTIRVESEMGRGTAFTVCLPLPVKEAVPGTTPEKKDPADTQSHAGDVRVLLVEDYKPNAMVAVEYLRQFGFGCDVAESGAEALERVQARDYHAILMDIQMHGLDGYRTTQAIRDYEEKAHRQRARIIGMTAHALVGDREKCLASGMDDYLSKPFNPEDLRKKLAS